MDNERDALEREQQRLDEKVGIQIAAKRIGLKPQTIRKFHIASGAFDESKLNSSRIGGTGHHRFTIREIERFIKDGGKK